jgi:hypothetical protein
MVLPALGLRGTVRVQCHIAYFILHDILSIRYFTTSTRPPCKLTQCTTSANHAQIHELDKTMSISLCLSITAHDASSMPPSTPPFARSTRKPCRRSNPQPVAQFGGPFESKHTRASKQAERAKHKGIQMSFGPRKQEKKHKKRHAVLCQTRIEGSEWKERERTERGIGGSTGFRISSFSHLCFACLPTSVCPPASPPTHPCPFSQTTQKYTKTPQTPRT